MQKGADCLKVYYRSILNPLDTNKATIKGGKLVLLFTSELTEQEKYTKLYFRGICILKYTLRNIWIQLSMNVIQCIIRTNYLNKILIFN